MAVKYQLAFQMRHGKEWDRPEDIEIEDIPLKLGNHQIFILVLGTPQGYKRVTVTANVEKYGVR